MKKYISIALVALIGISSLTAFDFSDIVDEGSVAAAQAEQANVTAGFDAFAIDLSHTITNSATQQNVWADAYIGLLFPKLPPHFGVGLNTALTTIETTGLKKVTAPLGLDQYVPDKLLMPIANAEARIGGIFLPFDIGASFMYFDTRALNNLKINDFGFGEVKLPNLEFIHADYLSVGADLRYCVLEESLLLPNVSVSALYNYTKGSISIDDQTVAKAKASIAYETHTAGLAAQVSKRFFGFLAPFGGGRILAMQTKNDWNYEKSGLNPTSLTPGGKLSASGSYTQQFVNIDSIDDLTMQVFAGLCLSVPFVDFTPSVSYDFTHNIWAGSFNIHFRL